jgi:hypothetical protein
VLAHLITKMLGSGGLAIGDCELDVCCQFSHKLSARAKRAETAGELEKRHAAVATA